MVGRIRFALERWDSPRHRSHVAQLFSLGCTSRLRELVRLKFAGQAFSKLLMYVIHELRKFTAEMVAQQFWCA